MDHYVRDTIYEAIGTGAAKTGLDFVEQRRVDRHDASADERENDDPRYDGQPSDISDG